MSKNVFISIPVATLTLLLISFVGCKKNNNDTAPVPGPVSASAVGTWSKAFDANDYNGNLKLDEDEKILLLPGTAELLMLRSDSTFYDSSGNSSGFTKSWGTYFVSGNYLSASSAPWFNNIFIPSSGRLIQLDAHTLILQDTSRQPAYWVGYAR